jgi:TIR domain
MGNVSAWMPLQWGTSKGMILAVEILETKVVIKQAVLRGSDQPASLQRVATVYINGMEYRIWAPPEATGDALDWVPHLRVKQLVDFNSEVEIRTDVSDYALEKVKQELEKRKREVNTASVIDPTEASGLTTKIEVFISHSSADATVARELIHLLRSAIPDLGPEVIRCTSVSGYRLEGGAKTDEQIQKELLGAKVFIGLLSRQSLQSTYVLFELGARWGAARHLLPLAVAGMSPSEFKAPLNGLNAHSAAVEADLFQLVGEVASRLGLSPAKPHVYADLIKRLVQISQHQGRGRSAEPSPDVPLPNFELTSSELTVGGPTRGDRLADLNLRT